MKINGSDPFPRFFIFLPPQLVIEMGAKSNFPSCQSLLQQMGQGWARGLRAHMVKTPFGNAWTSELQSGLTPFVPPKAGHTGGPCWVNVRRLGVQFHCLSVPCNARKMRSMRASCEPSHRDDTDRYGVSSIVCWMVLTICVLKTMTLDRFCPTTFSMHV